MLPILWRAAALDDLDAIVAYIAAENPMAAWGLRNDIVAGILPLSDHPTVIAAVALTVRARWWCTPTIWLFTA